MFATGCTAAVFGDVVRLFEPEFGLWVFLEGAVASAEERVCDVVAWFVFFWGVHLRQRSFSRSCRWFFQTLVGTFAGFVVLFFAMFVKTWFV